MYQVNCISPSIYEIWDEYVRAFLVTGTNVALLIDTGTSGEDLHSVISQYTNLPVAVVNTHHHFDHTAGNKQFEAVYIHKKDAGMVRDCSNKVICVEGGHRFELGGRTLEVLELAGHSAGNIGLLDRENRILFAGDTIADSPVYMNFPDSSMEDYIKTMDLLLSMQQEIDTIYCSHGTLVLDFSYVEALRTCALTIYNKEPYTVKDIKLEDGEKVKWAQIGKVSMYLCAKKAEKQKNKK